MKKSNEIIEENGKLISSLIFYRSARSRANRRRRHRRGGNGDGAGVVLTNYNSGDRFSPVNDPPPKYTPPPSYSTATGAR